MYCRAASIKKIALPALGTGVGKLDLQKVAQLFVEILGPAQDIEFLVVDIDPVFIYHVNHQIDTEVKQ
jgi:O-acetyl-ADP-ribose deacetylase (regulator of RNase III)